MIHGTMGAVVAMLALAGAAATPAAAADLVVRDDGSIGALAIAGDGVVWESGPLLDYVSFDEGPVRLRIKRPGRPARALATLGTYAGGVDDVKGGGGGTSVTGLDVFGGRVLVSAVEVGAGDPNDGGLPIYDGGVLRVVELARARQRTILRCPSSPIEAAALSWPRFAVRRCAAGPVQLRDAEDGNAAPAALAPGAAGVRAAGSLVAIRTADAIAVRDVDAGREVLRIALAGLPGRLGTGTSRPTARWR